MKQANILFYTQTGNEKQSNTTLSTTFLHAHKMATKSTTQITTATARLHSKCQFDHRWHHGLSSNTIVLFRRLHVPRSGKVITLPAILEAIFNTAQLP